MPTTGFAGAGPVFSFRDRKRASRALDADYLATIAIGMIAGTGAELPCFREERPPVAPRLRIHGPALGPLGLSWS